MPDLDNLSREELLVLVNELVIILEGVVKEVHATHRVAEKLDAAMKGEQDA